MTHKDKGHFEIEDRGAVLIDRVDGGPHALFGLEIANQLEEFVDRVDHDPNVHAVVITGAHPKRFISHADVRWLQEGGAASPSVGQRGASAIARAAEIADSASWNPWCAEPRWGQPSSSTACTRRSCG
jgi:enoyl-CoA hydratase/carnithine racemase